MVSPHTGGPCHAYERVRFDDILQRSGSSIFCYLMYIFTEFMVKPAMGYCFARLFVQSEYDVIVEDGIPRFLSHIGPPNSLYIVKYSIFEVLSHFTASDSHR